MLRASAGQFMTRAGAAPAWPGPQQQPRAGELGIADLTRWYMGNEISFNNVLYDAVNLQWPNLFSEHKITQLFHVQAWNNGVLIRNKTT